MKIDRKSLFRDESGTLTVFAVISYTTMIMLAGFAIDVAKVELERTKIQLAVDNAVLAGATLNMTPKPDTEDQYFSAAEIVDLYLAKADVPTDFLANYVVSDTPPAGLMPVDTGRYVEVSGSTSVATSFMHMLGFDYLDAGVGSTAMEVGEIPIEISLVIDVSASMASDTKLAALVVAAKEFVSIVMDGNDGVNPNLVSLSLVSYGSYVNAGRDLAAVVQGEYLYPEANINPDLLDYIPIEGLCGVFNDAAFTQAGLWDKGDFWAALPNTNWETNNAKASHSGHALEDSVCGNTLTSEILAVSNDEAEILKRLTDAKLFWGTSIDDGARWGVALLDPSMQGAINDLIGDGFSFVPGFPEDRVSYVEKDVLNDEGEVVGTVEERVVSSTQAVPAGMAGRPLAYGVGQKYMILMTDGANVSTKHPRPDYGDGWTNELSDWAYTPDDEEFWYKPSDDDLLLVDETDEDYATIISDLQDEGYFHLRWDELFAIRSDNEVAAFSEAWSPNTLFYSPQKNNKKDDRMHDVCDAAKGEGIQIFTIAYETKSSDVDDLAYCASEGYDYEATEENIFDIFTTIANAMQRLQLTN